MSTRITAFIFDLGGVLVIQDSARSFREFSRLSGVSEDILRQHFYSYFRKSSVDKAITPELFFKESKNNIQSVLTQKDWLALIRHLYSTETVNNDLVEWITAHPAFQYYVLTNSTTGVERILTDKFHIAHLFNQVISSAEIGARKPDIGVFGHVIGRIGIPAEQCVFVDDDERNIEAARSFGFSSIRYTDMATFCNKVAALLSY